MTAKCPKCDKVPSHIRVDSVSLKDNQKRTYNGFAFVCIHCNVILGISPDWSALTANLLKGLSKENK